MNILTRGLTAGAISIVGLLTIAGCSSHEEVSAVQPPPQVIVEPAPVASRTVTEKTTTVTPAPVPAPVVTEQTTTTRSVNDSSDSSGPDVAQQKTTSYHSESTTVTPAPAPAPVDQTTTTTYQKKTYESTNY